MELDHVPFEWVDEVIRVIAATPIHTYMILTKRPHRMLEYFRHLELMLNIVGDARLPIPNLWLGITAENQQRFDERWPILAQIPAVIRFVSLEPLLSDINFMKERLGFYCEGCGYTKKDMGFHLDHILCKNPTPMIDWVIVGGETGPKARPMHPDWVRSIRDQCKNAGVPFFFKGWGEYCAPSQMPEDTFRAWDCEHGTEGWDRDKPEWRVGKKKAGYLLDGQEWMDFPE